MSNDINKLLFGIYIKTADIQHSITIETFKVSTTVFNILGEQGI